jgi:hypothetical protein
MSHLDEAPREAGPTVPGRRVALYCLAIISVATAVIHFAVAGEHFQEYWLFGVFMLVTAWLQLLWAIVVITRPSRLLLWCGVILDVGVVIVYIVTRTIGDVVGPTPNAVEPVGFGDAFCTVLEAIVAVSCLWLLFARAGRQVTRHRLVLTTAAAGAATAVLLSLSLVAGGPEMVMSMSASPSTNMPGMQAPAIKLANATPAGDITMPDADMQMAAGMKMASPVPCTAAPTAAQQKAAVSLVNAAWLGASKYQSLAAAKAAGYRPLTPAGQAVVHYINPAYYLATLTGGPVLDTADPQSLVYANTPRGAVLAAAMYITAPHGATPQPGGCLTQWHVHTNLCLSRGRVVAQEDPTCPAGSRNRVTPPMMHVWFVPIPGGPTAIDAPDAQVVQAAERVTAPHNGSA